MGTIYMDMPLKPNILDDISKDHWISAPPPREKYRSASGEDQIMLEDESGRLRLVGTKLQITMLVTGCIVAVMGTENSNGDFEVIDLKIADLPRQPQRWERDDSDALLTNGSKGKGKTEVTESRGSGGKIAIVSGLGIRGDEANSLTLDLLMEFLLGESCGTAEQQSSCEISRLIIAGNSLSEASPLLSADEISGKKSSKKYGYDASAYNPAPTAHLDNFLATLLPSIPVTLIPGNSDPANVSLPQQPIHPAMLPHSRAYSAMPGATEPGWFDSTTNPWEGDIDGWRLIGNGGQPLDDVFKYVEGNDRLEMMENFLRWRCVAPTAPDTLCKSATLLIMAQQRSGEHRIRSSTRTAKTNRTSHRSKSANKGLRRVLSIPRYRPFCCERVSACVLRRQPAQIRENSDRGSNGSKSSFARDTGIQRHGRSRTSRHQYSRDRSCQIRRI